MRVCFFLPTICLNESIIIYVHRESIIIYVHRSTTFSSSLCRSPSSIGTSILETWWKVTYNNVNVSFQQTLCFFLQKMRQCFLRTVLLSIKRRFFFSYKYLPPEVERVGLRVKVIVRQLVYKWRLVSLALYYRVTSEGTGDALTKNEPVDFSMSQWTEWMSLWTGSTLHWRKSTLQCTGFRLKSSHCTGLFLTAIIRINETHA